MKEAKELVEAGITTIAQLENEPGINMLNEKQKLGVKYYDETPKILAYTIERINEQYTKLIQEGKLNGEIDRSVLNQAYRGSSININKNPLEYLFYNRVKHGALSRPKHHDQGEGRYQVDYAHGHDTEESKDNLAANFNYFIYFFIYCLVTSIYKINVYIKSIAN